MKEIISFLREWRDERRAIDQLQHLSERDLADIGITRSEIEYKVRRNRNED